MKQLINKLQKLPFKYIVLKIKLQLLYFLEMLIIIKKQQKKCLETNISYLFLNIKSKMQ